ncbi:MAG: hypothetical protein ACXACG_05265 [Candidatus Thorarchaeota archaeon]
MSRRNAANWVYAKQSALPQVYFRYENGTNIEANNCSVNHYNLVIEYYYCLVI